MQPKPQRRRSAGGNAGVPQFPFFIHGRHGASADRADGDLPRYSDGEIVRQRDEVRRTESV